MIFRLILIITLIFCCASNKAQQNTFSKTYALIGPPDYFLGIGQLSFGTIELNDGYIFMTGGWSLSISQGSGIALIKTDKLGNEVWRNEQYSNSFRYTAEGRITMDNDLNIYLFYERDTLVSPLRVGIMMLDKYTKDGDLIWRKPYYNNVAPYIARCNGIAIKDENIYLSGICIDLELTTQANSYYNQVLYCINKYTGELQWIQTYDTGSKDDYNDDLLISDDGHIFLSGLTNGLGASGLRGHLIKTDMEGNMIWQKLFPEIGDGGLMTINHFEGDKFILTGINYIQGQSTTRGKIIKIDSFGIINQSLTFTDSEPTLSLYRSNQISNGDLVSVGISKFNNSDCGLILKSDVDGNIKFIHRYDYGPNSDFFINFIETTDNHLLVIGKAFTGFETGADAWLLKLDSNGCLEPGCLEVGINEAEPELGITIYPNPTQDRLFIKMEASQKKPLNFSLYNLQGKLIIQESLVAEYESFDLSNLSTGVYLVHIIDNNGKKVSRKIVKN